MHIAFLTLFLGLISGRVPVELAVTGPGPATPGITAIELLLDGAPAGRLAGPPFRGQVDLGKALLPHHLEARGLDAKGAEVARAEQWLNLPQPSAEVDLVPETRADGRISAVRLAFRSVLHEPPRAVTASLDGAPLKVDRGAVTLPHYSQEVPHLLSVEARFSQGPTARRHLAFGGSLGSEASTELTAVPVRMRDALPRATELGGWFTTGSQALTLKAVEAGPGEILLVRDPNVPPAALEIGQRAAPYGELSLPRFELSLAAEDRVRLVDPGASWFSGEGGTSALFHASPELDSSKAGLYWRLAQTFLEQGSGAPHMADAVAVAGVQALFANRRRAVLLVLSGDATDVSRYDPATVRRYLAAIRVPLYVWSLYRPPYPAAIAAWGAVEDVSTLAQMRRAYRRLSRDLASQRILWFDGRHLPQSIALSPAAEKSIELVAGPER
ncbi:MAG TPA: hypothetical protein VGR07_07290 [Thermoanaerobaculia bacterium]|nr:hypothetical protein [Thermoanaerobaculia bacterium]